MNVFTNSALAGSSGQAAGGGYQIERSLRFNSADSSKLTRTPSTAGNRKTWTWSGWVKRTTLSRSIVFSNANASAINGLICEFLTGNTLRINNANSSGTVVSGKTTTRLFRDTTAWYHLVAVYDSTNATAGDRLRLYVNGVRETNFSSSTDPALNADSLFNTTSLTAIGWLGSHSTLGAHAYLAEIHFIDGQALAASDFGELDDNNVWQPKGYSGSYGTNGYYLDFSDNSSAAALGTDSSGNDNDFTVTNLSVTAGADNDSLRDSPTNGTQTDTGVGGEVVGNYATLNPLINSPNVTLSNGNLDFVVSANNTAAYRTAFANIGMTSGKWYFEGTVTSRGGDALLGISNKGLITNQYIGSARTTSYKADSYSYGGVGGAIYPASTSTGYATYTTGDIISCAFDADNGELYFAKNGVWQASSDPANNTSPSFSGLTDTPYFFGVTAGGGGNWDVNFGQRPFSYTAPSGYKCLCTANLPEPTIEDGSTAFETVLDTGADILSTAQAAIGGSADLLWIKDRANTNNHQVIDTVRGGTSSLQSNTNVAETTYVAPSGNSVAWTWDAGSSNTSIAVDGISSGVPSIASEYRANPSAGFSIVSYTGDDAASGTIAHGLNAAPSMIIAKRLDGTNAGVVYHSGVSATPQNSYLNLFATTSTGTAVANSGIWNNTAPTANVFTVGTAASVNTAADYIAYCFAPVEGYSAFGSYPGNGSADGPFVYLGFRPAFVMFKCIDSAQTNWAILDNTRDELNPMNEWLYPNKIRQSYSPAMMSDFTSNGFKLKHNQIYFNATGKNYIYAAFAEHPLKTARAR
jgi:hypothetical protein